MAKYSRPKKEKSSTLLLVVLILLVTLSLSSLTVLVLFRARERNTSDKVNFAVEQKKYFNRKNLDYLKQIQILQQITTGDANSGVEPVKGLLDRKKAEHANKESDKSTGVVTIESFFRWAVADLGTTEKSVLIAESDETTARNNEEHQSKAFLDLSEKLDDQIAIIKGEITKIDDDVEVKIEEFSRKKVEKDEALKTIQQEKEDIEARYEKQERDIKMEIKRLEELIRQNSVRKEPVTGMLEKQGYVMNPSRSAKTAYINLGTEDNLVLGMKFRVFTEVKAGVIKWKGMVEVKKILEQHRSEVSITNQSEAFEPIVDGDLITNPFYGRKDAKIIVLVGRFEEQNFPYFGNYSLEELKRRITGFNVKIADSVTVDTSFIVKGLRREESQTDEQNTEMATLLAIPQLSIKDLLDYLEY
ncbi:MAG: hypothetical protein HZA48_00440 [Planctomycetes bacterium]|nr:hypothetical protein [Planctomycetota bacterium]